MATLFAHCVACGDSLETSEEQAVGLHFECAADENAIGSHDPGEADPDTGCSRCGGVLIDDTECGRREHWACSDRRPAWRLRWIAWQHRLPGWLRPGVPLRYRWPSLRWAIASRTHGRLFPTDWRYPF
jgi:hypothetical protein